jgi:peptidoglycan hydrolase-like protein with peptidoglycan-binding domain
MPEITNRPPLSPLVAPQDNARIALRTPVPPQNQADPARPTIKLTPSEQSTFDQISDPAQRTAFLQAKVAELGRTSVAPHTLLRQGANGEQVAVLKKWLADQGFYPCQEKYDNTFDEGLTEAVRQYQDANGLQVDGVVGQQTWGSFYGMTGERMLPPGKQLLTGTNPTTGKPATAQELDTNRTAALNTLNPAQAEALNSPERGPGRLNKWANTALALSAMTVGGYGLYRLGKRLLGGKAGKKAATTLASRNAARLVGQGMTTANAPRALLTSGAPQVRALIGPAGNAGGRTALNLARTTAQAAAGGTALTTGGAALTRAGLTSGAGATSRAAGFMARFSNPNIARFARVGERIPKIGPAVAFVNRVGAGRVVTAGAMRAFSTTRNVTRGLGTAIATRGASFGRLGGMLGSGRVIPVLGNVISAGFTVYYGVKAAAVLANRNSTMGQRATALGAVAISAVGCAPGVGNLVALGGQFGAGWLMSRATGG